MIRATLALLLALLAASRPGGAAELGAGEPLTREVVAALVEAELRGRGEGERFAVEVDAPPLPLANRASRPAQVSLLELRREPAGGRLSARLGVRLASGEASAIEVSGRARRLVEVAVPARRVERGETFSADDVEFVWVPEGQVRDGTTREAADLVGREARRTLPPGRAVRAGDLVSPRLVARGEPVTLLFASRGMELTAAGEALDAGAEGEVVRVVNPGSSLVRRGIVVGPRLVRVAGARGDMP